MSSLIATLLLAVRLNQPQSPFILTEGTTKLLTYLTYSVIYNLYFHPLCKFPGSSWWICSEIVPFFAFTSGRFPQRLERLHSKYGEVVRFGPQDLAFFIPDAWQDIYGQDKQKAFIKDPRAYRMRPAGVPDLLTANGADHRRYRTLVGHAFSDQALREQQPIVESHVDLLVFKLKEVSRNNETVDIHEWLKCTAFDLIGDLAFGESFGCLENSRSHPLVAQTSAYVKSLAIVTVLDVWLPMQNMLRWAPKFVFRAIYKHLEMTREKIERRLATGTNRKDFMHFILPNDEKGINHQELMANMALLIIAGSETTASTLAATIYLLLKNPGALERLNREIFTRFKGVEDMTVNRLSAFEYLNATIQESMRVHAPVPVGLPRVITVDDAVVAGYAVPKGTSVTLQNYAAYRSPQNFTDSINFEPLRWTEGGRRTEDLLNTVEPFGIGPRNCIGKSLAWAEMRLILVRLLFEFDFVLLDDDFQDDNQKVFGVWNPPPLNVKLRPRT